MPVCHNITPPPSCPNPTLFIISHNMLPTFHMTSFKPWTPPHRKQFSLHKSPNSCSPRTQNPPSPKPCHNSLPSILPSPKHHLPARPPAEVCVPTNAGSQSRPPPSNFQSQPRETTAPEPHTYPGIPKRATKSPKDLAPHISEPDMVSRCNLQENTGIPTEPPPFRGDTAEDGLSSPSISSSGGSLEEFLRLPDAQDEIPIDPVILANHGSWDNMDLELSTPQVADGLIDSETICPYPDPPSVLCSSTGHYRDRSERVSGQNDSIQANDHHDSQQLRSPQQNASPDASYSDGARKNDYDSVSGKPTSAKRKAGCSQTASNFLSVAVQGVLLHRPSFSLCVSTARRASAISLLAVRRCLSRCMSEDSSTSSNQGEALTTSHSTASIIEQGRQGSTDVHRSSRKGMKWSQEESDLLLKLRKDERRPWAEVTRLFLEKYPGRSPGAIQEK